jgi:predicted transposase/invertase (TIGR01784 family)
MMSGERSSPLRFTDSRNRTGVCDTSDGDIVEVHTIELKKMPKTPDSGTDAKGLQEFLWLSLIKAEREEDVQMLATKDPAIQETYGVLKKLSANERARMLYESREKAIRDEQARSYVARLEGVAKGFEEGVAKGFGEGLEEGVAKGIEEGVAKGSYNTAIETARKLLGKKMPIDEISDITGLSQKEIQAL